MEMNQKINQIIEGYNANRALALNRDSRRPGHYMFFKTLSRSQITVPYSPTDTVLAIKQKIHSQLGDKYPWENVDFIFLGTVFQNEEQIGKYKVPHDAMVLLLVNDLEDVNPDMERVLQIMKEREQQASKITEKEQTDK